MVYKSGHTGWLQLKLHKVLLQLPRPSIKDTSQIFAIRTLNKRVASTTSVHVDIKDVFGR